MMGGAPLYAQMSPISQRPNRPPDITDGANVAVAHMVGAVGRRCGRVSQVSLVMSVTVETVAEALWARHEETGADHQDEDVRLREPRLV